jgi:class 3 adenylate cyclase
MTVLFCDLVDSVGMSVRLDPEELMRIFDRYRSCCDEIIAQHTVSWLGSWATACWLFWLSIRRRG